MILSQGLRSSFTLVLGLFKQLLAKKKIAAIPRLTQSELVLSAPIAANTTNYVFPVLDNEISAGQAVRPDEIRLNINDEFIITHVGIYLGARLRGEGIPDDTYEYLTCPPIELTNNSTKLLPLYAGQMRIDVNNVNFIENWHLKKHQHVQRTQFQNTDATNQFCGTLPSVDFSEAVYPVEPHIALSGSKKNNIQIFLPRSIEIVTTDVTPNTRGVKLDITIDRIYVVFRGLLAQNAAKFQ
jgi:hypothetical protein